MEQDSIENQTPSDELPAYNAGDYPYSQLESDDLATRQRKGDLAALKERLRRANS